MLERHKVYICCSGGIDSSALIGYYLEQGFEIKALRFNYGHLAYKEEKKALDAICRHFNVQTRHARLLPAISKTIAANGELVGRNALLILSALAFLQNDSSLISLGLHADSPYYDCSPAFVDHMQNVLDGYFGGTVLLDIPFLRFRKPDIIVWCQKNNIPLDLTYSCQKGSMPPCGICSSCLERKLYGL